LLFLPRGFVHQAEALTSSEGLGQHSLHVTLSTAQNNAWADFLELVVPQALAATVADEVSLRRSLPANYLAYTGAAHSDLPAVVDGEDGEDEDEEEEEEEEEEEDDDGDVSDEGDGAVALVAAAQRGEWSRAKARAAFRLALRGHLEGVVEQCLDLADSAADQMAKRCGPCGRLFDL
jgi:uncharacterized lipoprotein YmbA